VSYKILTGICVIALAAFAPACNKTEDTTNANANANVAAPTTTTRPGPDNSTITTTTDANGVTTETRTFNGNPRVSKVVVTTRNGQKTARVYSASGEESDLKSDVGHALDATGNAIADAAGWTKDKTVEGAKTVGSAAKTVGEKTAEGAKTVGTKTAEGAKTVGEKTVEGTKKVGSAIKKAVKP
jgi:hypothetical protein